MSLCNKGNGEETESLVEQKEDFVTRLVKEESASKLFKIDSKCVKEDSIAIMEKEEYFSKLVTEEAVYKFVKEDSVFLKEESVHKLEKRGSKLTREGLEVMRREAPGARDANFDSKLGKDLSRRKRSSLKVDLNQRKRSSLKEELVIGKRDSLSVTWDSHVGRHGCVPVTV